MFGAKRTANSKVRPGTGADEGACASLPCCSLHARVFPPCRHPFPHPQPHPKGRHHSFPAAIHPLLPPPLGVQRPPAPARAQRAAYPHCRHHRAQRALPVLGSVQGRRFLRQGRGAHHSRRPLPYPQFDTGQSCQPYFNVYENNVFRYTSKPSEGMVPTFKRQLHTNMAYVGLAMLPSPSVRLCRSPALTPHHCMPGLHAT